MSEKTKRIIHQLLEAPSAANRWQLVSQNSAKRVEQKTVKGVAVQRFQRYGLHAKSLRGQGILGNYAQPRWATIGYEALGLFFTSWGDVMSFVNDPEYVEQIRKDRGEL